MKIRKSSGDHALPCATPVSKVIVAHCGSLGAILTVECSYSDTAVTEPESGATSADNCQCDWRVY